MAKFLPFTVNPCMLVAPELFGLIVATSKVGVGVRGHELQRGRRSGDLPSCFFLLRVQRLTARDLDPGSSFLRLNFRRRSACPRKIRRSIRLVYYRHSVGSD